MSERKSNQIPDDLRMRVNKAKAAINQMAKFGWMGNPVDFDWLVEQIRAIEDPDQRAIIRTGVFHWDHERQVWEFEMPGLRDAARALDVEPDTTSVNISYIDESNVMGNEFHVIAVCKTIMIGRFGPEPVSFTRVRNHQSKKTSQ